MTRVAACVSDLIPARYLRQKGAVRGLLSAPAGMLSATHRALADYFHCLIHWLQWKISAISDLSAFPHIPPHVCVRARVRGRARERGMYVFTGEIGEIKDICMFLLCFSVSGREKRAESTGAQRRAIRDSTLARDAPAAFAGTEMRTWAPNCGSRRIRGARAPTTTEAQRLQEHYA